MGSSDQLTVYKDLLDQIGVGASAGGVVAQMAFTEFFGEFLVNTVNYIGDLTDSYFCRKWKKGNMRVDAYSYDAQTHDLTLVISEFSDSETPESIGLAEVRTKFEQARRFFRACGVEEFRSGLEDTEDVVPLVHLIRDNINLISRVRYILITNKTLGGRVKDSAFDEMKRADGSVESEFTVWDFARYFDQVSSSNPQTEIEVDCTEFSPDKSGLPFLTSESAGLKERNGVSAREYHAYLLMIPGRYIHHWYSCFADRLLEQNVRTFLQFKGKVNRGIRETLHMEPNRFLAYNNGLTATAESVEFDGDGTRIVSIKNLQIVNGGQTTASIYSAFKKDDPVLEKISVQMKLIVTSGKHVDDLVSKISRYANSQNKIKDTDFASNKLFMLRIEGFSRRVTANPAGTFRGTRWFFERTRGQYLNSINVISSEGERTKFKKRYPKDHVFTKSDMAKYVLSWDWAPWIVAKGAEKAFLEFEKRHFGSDVDTLPGKEMVPKWNFKKVDGNPQFSEYYYKELIGKAILYRHLDKMLRKCEWCIGYKSQIITYTISVFRFLLYKTGALSFDFNLLWSQQMVQMDILDYLVDLAHEVSRVMVETAEGRNVAEWAKKQELWVVLKSHFRNHAIPDYLKNSVSFIPVELLIANRRKSEMHQIELNAREQLMFVLATDDKVWQELQAWIKTTNFVATHAQSDALICRVHSKESLDAEGAKLLINLWQRAAKEGFPCPLTDEAE